MSGLVKHAKRELELAGFLDENGIYDGDVGESVIELMRVFSKQGHSGLSAPIVSSLFNKLASYEPLNPITGNDDEWGDVSEGDLYQNKRCSALMKLGKDGEPYYLDAIVWSVEDDLDSFTGTVENINSHQYTHLPFVPKTFYIDVVKEKYDPKNPRHIEDDTVEMDDEKYVYLIKNHNDLDDVFKYYKKV
jgi:hypothetical protein